MTRTETVPGRPYQGRSAQERRAERRERLLQAATRLYGTRGFRATTIKDVCDEAGVTQRYFYEAFASAEELLCAATGKVTTTIRQEVRSAAQDAPGRYEALHSAALAYFTHLGTHPEVARLTLFEMEGVSADVDAFYRADLQKSTDLIQELMLAAARAAPADLRLDLLARGVLGAMYQLAKEWTRGGLTEPPEVMARHLEAIGLGVLVGTANNPPPA